MSRIKSQYKSYRSVLMSVTLVAALTLSSLAASVASETVDEGILDGVLVPQTITGMLTAKGPVLVNGNDAKTGATVTDGSVIQTRTGGHALIELGAPGRVELDPITAITLGMTPNSINATLNKCGMGVTLFLPAGVSGAVKILHISDVGVLDKDREIEVKVSRGEVLVKYGQGKERTIKAGDRREFNDAIEVTATGDAVFKVFCDKDHYPLLLWAGLLALAIPIADATGGEGPILPVISPPTP